MPARKRADGMRTRALGLGWGNPVLPKHKAAKRYGRRRCYRMRRWCGGPCLNPGAWFRYWFTFSLFGNLVWYVLGAGLSALCLFAIKHALGDYVPGVGTGVDFALRIATAENVALSYNIAIVQLVVNLAVSMAYNITITKALSAVSATCIVDYLDFAHRLRVAMAMRAVNMEYWVRHNHAITVLTNKLDADLRRYTEATPESERFEEFRTNVNTAVQLYYNPLTIRLFVHSVLTVGWLMAIKTTHNLKQDGLAALPFTLFIGVFFTGFLLFIKIADNPFFDDGAAPRALAHTVQELESDSELSNARVAPTSLSPPAGRKLSRASTSTDTSVSVELSPANVNSVAPRRRRNNRARRNAIVGDLLYTGAGAGASAGAGRVGPSNGTDSAQPLPGEPAFLV